MTDTDWPYDADRNDPLTAMRIPVTGAWPECNYLATYGGRAEPFLKWPRLDDAEAAMLACYIDFLRSKHEPHVQRRMLAAPLDVGDRSAFVFVKRGDSDWAYRAAHWRTGPFWVPLPEHIQDGRKVGLLQLLDEIETNHGVTPAPVWDAWKAAHPDVFGAADLQLPGLPAPYWAECRIKNGAPLSHWVYRFGDGHGMSVRQGSRDAHGVYGETRDQDYEIAVGKFGGDGEFHPERIAGMTDDWPDQTVIGWRKLDYVHAIYRELAARAGDEPEARFSRGPEPDAPES